MFFSFWKGTKIFQVFFGPALTIDPPKGNKGSQLDRGDTHAEQGVIAARNETDLEFTAGKKKIEAGMMA